MSDETIVLNQTLGASTVQNVLCFNNWGVVIDDLQEFADAIRLGFLNFAQPHLVGSWSLNSITWIKDSGPARYSIEQGFTLGPLQGNTANGEYIAQAALLVSTRYIGEPPNRGRIYFGGLSSELLTNTGDWEVATKEAFQLMVEAWAAGITTSTNQHFLRIGRRDPQGFFTVTSPVQEVIGRGNPAIQRSRRKFQGS